MPFVSNMPDNEEEKPTTPSSGPVSPTGGGGGAVHLAPSSAVASVGGGGTSGSGTTNPAGGSFASLDKYLSANQGQAEPLANKLTTGIGQQYNTLQGQNTSTLNDINSQIASNATPGNYNETLAQESANPASFSSNPENVASFQNLLNASYKGPASAESTPGFTIQQNAINNAISTGQNATQTEAGRKELLSQNEATPTTGVTALNSAILSQSPTALNNVENAYKPFSNLLTGLNTGAQTANQNISKAQSDAAAANAAANKQITNQIGTLNTNLSDELAKATAARDAYNNQLTQARTVWNPINTDINSLNEMLGGMTKGFTPVAGATSSIANPLGQYINAPISATAPSLETVATPQDYANAQAFQNLLKGLNTGITAPVLNPATANQAGTYVAPTAPTITDPKAQAKALYDAMNQTLGAYNKQPNGMNMFTANPWMTAPTPSEYPRYQQNYQQTMPVYNDLTKLLNQIYGGPIAKDE